MSIDDLKSVDAAIFADDRAQHDFTLDARLLCERRIDGLDAMHDHAFVDMRDGTAMRGRRRNGWRTHEVGARTATDAVGNSPRSSSRWIAVWVIIGNQILARGTVRKRGMGQQMRRLLRRRDGARARTRATIGSLGCYADRRWRERHMECARLRGISRHRVQIQQRDRDQGGDYQRLAGQGGEECELAAAFLAAGRFEQYIVEQHVRSQWCPSCWRRRKTSRALEVETPLAKRKAALAGGFIFPVTGTSGASSVS